MTILYILVYAQHKVGGLMCVYMQGAGPQNCSMVCVEEGAHEDLLHGCWPGNTAYTEGMFGEDFLWSSTPFLSGMHRVCLTTSFFSKHMWFCSLHYSQADL